MLRAIGKGYSSWLADNPDLLLLQLQSYAACGDDEEIQRFVRLEYARLVELVRKLSGIEDEERLDGFFQTGMWCNVAAALGVEDFSVGSGWASKTLKGAKAKG